VVSEGNLVSDEEDIVARIESLLAGTPGRLLNAGGNPNARGQELLERILEAARAWIDERIAIGRGGRDGGTSEPGHASG
jgi:hypothetical protein